MLNEWSDRVPKSPPRPRLLRAEFWLPVVAWPVTLSLIASSTSCLWR
ncbi:MAG TPA: hypothetical protein VEZ20_12740 [Allosphingosinicella sp.]|jgi:hypothetical protein|nr:hypothetical protein [Allosphingosinicella sp.]